MTKNKNKLNDNILDLYKNMENILKNKSYWFFKTFFKSQKKSVRNKLQNYFQSKGSEIYEDFKKALNTAI
jgi:flavodoxin